jgi:hypothetical protein
MALQRANKRERKRERLTAERLAPWGGVSFTLIPFIHFIFIDSIKTKMKFIRHFVHSTHNLCFQLHFFASLAARLLCGLVAVRLLPPLTPNKLNSTTAPLFHSHAKATPFLCWPQSAGRKERIAFLG